jgi:hypothetical protein
VTIHLYFIFLEWLALLASQCINRENRRLLSLASYHNQKMRVVAILGAM